MSSGPAGFVPLVTPASPHGELDEMVATMRAVITRGAYRVPGGFADAVARAVAELYSLPASWDLLTFRSGTEALTRALVAVGVTPGDLVAVPDLAYHAVAGTVLAIGCTPVPVDVDEHDWNLSPTSLSETIERHALRAVVAVDNYGTPCNRADLGRRCHDAGLPLVLDACESLGAEDSDGSVAEHVDAIVSSFSFTKPVHAAGAGGALALAHDAAARLQAMPEQLVRQSQLPELNAAYLLGTWSHLAGNVARLRAQYARYRDALVPVGFVGQEERAHSTRLHAPFLLPDGRTPADRSRLVDLLLDAGIEARAMFPSQSRLLGLGVPPPASGAVDRRVLCLPTGAGLAESGIAERVLATVEGW